MARNVSTRRSDFLRCEGKSFESVLGTPDYIVTHYSCMLACGSDRIGRACYFVAVKREVCEALGSKKEINRALPISVRFNLKTNRKCFD